MIQPSVTHVPCDLNQQRRRIDARRAAVAGAVAAGTGRRRLLGRLLRRSGATRGARAEIPADVLAQGGGEDVLHSFRF